MPPRRRGDREPASRAASDEEGEEGGESEESWTDEEDKEKAVEKDQLPEDGEALKDKLIELMEGMEEKRSSTREAAIKGLRKLLSARHLKAQMDGRMETMLENLKRSIKRGSASESRDAAEVVALCFLLMGPENDAIFDEFRLLFQEAIRTSSSDDAKPAYAMALGMACFISCSEPQSALATLDLLEEVFSRNYSPLAARAAIDSWCLLASSLPSSTVTQRAPNVMKSLKKCLKSENSELRISAGTACALLFEILRDEEEEEEFDFEKNGMEEIVELLEALSKDSDKRKAKKERSKQRSMFREIIGTVKSKEPPELVLKFKHETMEFTSWAEIQQVQSLRQLLAEGFHVHFQQNDVVRAIFGLPPALDLKEVNPQKMSTLEKRFYQSPNSEAAKSRSKWLDSRRKTKASHHHHSED